MLRTIFFAASLVAFSSSATENQVSTKEANPFKQTMWYFTEMHLNQAGPDDILFFGDSIVQGMNMDGLKFKAVNMGIGGYTLAEIANRMKAVRLQDYRAVIVEGGVNDVLIGRSEDEIKLGYENLFREASRSNRFYLSQMLPVLGEKHENTNKIIRNLNEYTSSLCKKTKNCRLIKSPSVMWKHNNGTYFFPDGIHLRKKGYKAWVTNINYIVK